MAENRAFRPGTAPHVAVRTSKQTGLSTAFFFCTGPKIADRTSRTEGDYRIDGPDRPDKGNRCLGPPDSGPRRNRHRGCL